MRWYCNRRNNEEVARNVASRRAKGFWPVPLQCSACIFPICSPLVVSARLKIPLQKHREFMSQSTRGDVSIPGFATTEGGW